MTESDIPENIRQLLTRRECSTVEFKATAFVDRDGERVPWITTSVLESVAAFLNSNGGTVLIGIDDKTGGVIGLEGSDLRCWDDRKTDSWQNEFSNAMHGRLGSLEASAVGVELVVAAGRIIAVLTCQALQTGVILNAAAGDSRGPRMMVRVGTSDRALQLDEIRTYFERRVAAESRERQSATGASLRRPLRRSPIEGTGAGLAATLRRLYPAYPLLKFAGEPAPIWIQPARAEEWFDLEAPLGRLETRERDPRGEYPPDCDRCGEQLYAGYRRTAHPRHLFDGPTFALDGIRLDGGRVKIDCKVSRYFLSLATSEVLDRELRDTQATLPDSVRDLSDLPRRRWLHERIENPVMDGRHRRAAVSIATTLVFAGRDDVWRVLVAPRSAKVATHPLANHVAPSGIFSPLGDGLTAGREEFLVRGGVYREFAEEIYGDTALELSDTPYGDLLAVPALERLTERLATGDADLVYTGVSVNLLTLRPEITTLLLIRDPDWIHLERDEDPPLRVGWEYLGREDAKDLADREWIDALELDADFLPIGHGQLGPSVLVPNAAAALALAAPVAAELAER